VQPQVKSPVACPKCGEANALSHTDLDRLLENNEEIEAVCFYCEYKWKLDAQEKARLRNQRKELKKVAGM
jgi:DNA-directed RNA polymerase subunit M/transcription elongation factor TFIIS